MLKYADLNSLRTLASLCKAEFASNATVMSVTEALEETINVNIAQNRALTALAYHCGMPAYSLQVAMEWNPLTHDRSAAYLNDTQLEVFPKVDMTGTSSMLQMFSGCTNLHTYCSENPGTVTDMRLAFSGCAKLETVDVLNTAGATKINRAFMNCTSLRSVNEDSAFYIKDHTPVVCLNDVDGIYDFGGCFQYCSSIENFETNLRQTDSGYYGVYDDSGFAVQDLSMMFMRCTSLKLFVNSDQWLFSPDYNCYRNCYRMFMGCSSLRVVDYLNMANAVNVTQMFAECRNIRFLGLAFIGRITSGDLFPENTEQYVLDFGDLAYWGDDSENDTSYTSSLAGSCLESVKNSLLLGLETWQYGNIEAIIMLSAYTKGLLSDDEIAEITSKGYTVA